MRHHVDLCMLKRTRRLLQVYLVAVRTLVPPTQGRRAGNLLQLPHTVAGSCCQPRCSCVGSAVARACLHSWRMAAACSLRKGGTFIERPQPHGMACRVPTPPQRAVAAPRTRQRISNVQASVNTGAAPPAAAARPPARPRAPSTSRDALNDPAQIGAQGRAAAAVTDLGGEVSLSTYMRLPVEQYYILDPNQITFLAGNRFILAVPRIELFGSWLQPTIEVEVFPGDTSVRLVADHCKIQGNGPLSGLNGKFAMSFTTELTWGSSSSAAVAVAPAPATRPNSTTPTSSSSRSGSPFVVTQRAVQQPDSPTSSSSSGYDLGAQLRDGWERLTHPGTSSHPVPGSPGEIRGTCAVDVWCEVIPPFHLMPRPLLVSSCNAVLGGLVSSLLPLFLRQLAADYGKWAADPAYRTARAARSAPLVKP